MSKDYIEIRKDKRYKNGKVVVKGNVIRGDTGDVEIIQAYTLESQFMPPIMVSPQVAQIMRKLGKS
jgi:hypothetical protein